MVTPAPVNFWGHLTAKAARLELAVILLSGALLLDGGARVWELWRGHPIYYVPMGGPGLSQPGVVPETEVFKYATEVLQARYTFTPATIKAAHATFLSALHPSLSVAFTAQAEREVLMVKDHKLSSQLTVLDTAMQRVDPRQKVFSVRLVARRTVWIGGQQVRDEPIHAEMTLTAWITHGHPGGLVMTQFSTTPPLSVSGM